MGEPWVVPDALGAYCDRDLELWLADGAAPPSFADALHVAARARFLRAAIGPSHGREVETGLARADVDAALRLASTPAVDRAAFDDKRLVLRDGALITSCGLIRAMIQTALDHDARRLGVGRTPGGVGAASRSRAAPAPSRRTRRRRREGRQRR